MIWPETFAPQAIRDVEDAADWIADHGGGVRIARRMVLATLRSSRLIVDRPMLGQTRQELLPSDFRFWRVRDFPFLIVYNANRSPARIVRILHMSRDLAPLLTGLDNPSDEESGADLAE